jgi:hypothetical protein
LKTTFVTPRGPEKPLNTPWPRGLMVKALVFG